MKTRFTELVGIEHPIVLPGMSWISGPDLVAAVCEAGGLGILASGPLRPDETRTAIRRIRTLTDRPFGVGVTLMMPGASENMLVAVEEQAPILNYALGKGRSLVESVHAYGGTAIATVSSRRHAVSAQEAGADAVLLTGHEAAGHGSRVGTMVLLPTVADAVDVPVVAAGGIADGRGLLAALSLGAEAVAMGTRFAASSESPLHGNTKSVIVDKDASETLYTDRFDGMWARVMETPTSRKVTRRHMSFPETAVRSLLAARSLGMPMRTVAAGLAAQYDKARLLAYFGAAVPRVEAATISGDLEHGVQFIGQVQGLVYDVAPAAEILRRVLAEAAGHHAELGAQFAPDTPALTG